MRAMARRCVEATRPWNTCDAGGPGVLRTWGDGPGTASAGQTAETGYRLRASSLSAPNLSGVTILVFPVEYFVAHLGLCCQGEVRPLFGPYPRRAERLSRAQPSLTQWQEGTDPVVDQSHVYGPHISMRPTHLPIVSLPT